MLERQLGLLPKSGDKRGPPLHRLQSVACEVGKFREVARAEVGDLVLLQVAPDVLRGIEFGSVAGQALDLNVALQTLQIILDDSAAMPAKAKTQRDRVLYSCRFPMLAD